MLQDKMMNCMTVIVGKAVSASGRVLVAHNEDDPGHVIVRHAIVPAADHASGELIPAEKGLARIPQVPHTLGYYWVEYVKDEGGVTAADAYLNECGVVITSNSMGWSKEDDDDPNVVKDGGIGYVLRRALAERAHTAREGAHVLMALIDEWGYAPSGRAYTIADKNEAFMFQLVRGRHYVGARVPDDAVVVMPNHYTFHTLSDCPEMFYSKDIVRYAVEKGWYVPKTTDYSDFDFAEAYQGEKTWRHAGNLLRQKHGQRIVLGRDWDIEREGTPFCVYPHKPIDIETLARVMSCHYEGTQDDVDRFGPGRSPHNSPTARRICTGTTLESDLWEFADEPWQTCVYTAFGRPCQVPYLPIHPLMGLPESIKADGSGAELMAHHLERQPGATCANDSTFARFRRLCGAEEMLHSDVFDGVQPLLREIFAEARRESVEALKLKDAAVRDEAFLQAALAKLEAYAKRKFNMVEVVSASEMRLSTEAAAISVEFAMEGIPQEDTLRFGVEFTHVIDAFAPACGGSLRREGKNHWVAEFEFEPMKKVLPCPGRHTFFLGGRLEGGPAFAGRIVAEVKA